MSIRANRLHCSILVLAVLFIYPFATSGVADSESAPNVEPVYRLVQGSAMYVSRSGEVSKYRAEQSSSTSNEYLSAIWGVSGSQIWAVGNKDAGVLVKFWSGNSWSDIPAPTPGTSGSFRGVGGTAANDVWAVGYYRDSVSTKTLIEHWDGSAWTIIPSVNPISGADSTSLSSVYAISRNDVWAVGNARQPTASTFTYSIVIEHFDGTAWTVASNPSPTHGILSGVHGRSSNDVWAVGQTAPEALPLILHWNGSVWTSIPISASPSNEPFDLGGVYEISSNDTWAVGGPFLTITAHWDGSMWRQVNSPNPSANRSSFFNAVAGTSVSDVWAVGGYDFGNHTLAAHWDGSQWKVIKTPDPAPAGADALFGVAAFSAVDAWAVGDAVVSGGSPIILHWDGKSWRSVGNTKKVRQLQSAGSCDTLSNEQNPQYSPRNRNEHCPPFQKR